MGAYVASGQATNTASQTLGYLAQPATPRNRLRVFEIECGGPGATGTDDQVAYMIRVFTDENVTPGGTAGEIENLDRDDVAPTETCIEDPTGETTGNVDMFPLTHAQRSFNRWQVLPEHGIIVPAAEDNGVSIFTTAVGASTFTARFHMLYTL